MANRVTQQQNKVIGILSEKLGYKAEWQRRELITDSGKTIPFHEIRKLLIDGYTIDEAVSFFTPGRRKILPRPIVRID